MRNYILGVATGLLLGAAGTALAAQIVGNSGYLLGWEVELNGETVCSDPYVWPTLKQLECS